MIADPVGRQSHVCLTRRIFIIAVIVLEIWAGIEQREFELVFQGFDALVVVRHAFGTGHKDKRQAFIAVNIQEQIHAGFHHFFADGKDFGTSLQSRVFPFAVEVGAGGIGAQITQNRTVRIHIRHNIESRTVKQHARGRILRIKQTTQQTFDKPFRHGFARMLTSDNPDFHVAFDLVADGQKIDVTALNGTAQVVDTAQAAALRIAQKIQMLLVGIRLEIGVVNAVGQRRMVDGQHAVFIAGRHAKPILAVVRGASLIVLPAQRIRSVRRIFKMHHAVLIGRTLQTEVKPLGKLRSIVGTQGETDIGRVAQVFDNDRTGIELGADFHHGYP